MRPNILIYNTPEDLAEGFAVYMQSLIEKSNKNSFHIALSGGSTPKLLFNCLANKYRDQIKWNIIHLWWGDERMVPPDDSESNYKMTKDNLLSFIDIPADNIHRIHGEESSGEETNRYSSEIKKFIPSNNNLPVFDLIILGMGEDGHTASIFPNQMELLDSTEICEVAPHPVSGQKRITLTGNVINNAKIVAFIVTGTRKAGKIAQIFSKAEVAASYPAAHINPTGKLVWFLDKPASEGLNS
jgi:6-phosphogluconolactonase